MSLDYDQAIARRRQLLEVIVSAANELADLDRQLPVLQSMALEADLHQAEPIKI